MTADVELLPLYAELQGHPKLEIIKHYTRANVAHATAAKDDEIEALRAEVERAVEVAQAGARLVAKAASQRDAEKARAERLAEALRPLAAMYQPEAVEYMGDQYPDHDFVFAVNGKGLRLGDLRRAAAALRDHDKEGKDG